jgi:hypothetical protein
MKPINNVHTKEHALKTQNITIITKVGWKANEDR